MDASASPTRHRQYLVSLSLLQALLLAACSQSPPHGQVVAEIEKAILGARLHVFDAGTDGAEVVSMKLKAWTAGGLRGTSDSGPANYATEWTAKLQFTEPLALVETVIDGTKVVRIVAKKGDSIDFAGSVSPTKLDNLWTCGAWVKGDPWSSLMQEGGDIKIGYQVSNAGGSSTAFRRTIFEPVSKLGPYVEEGSPELKKLLADARAKQIRAREIAAAQNRKRQEAAAEKQRLAGEEAKRKAEQERHARLLPLVKPFQSKPGSVITADAGASLGSLLLEAEADEAKLMVKGPSLPSA